MSLWLGAGLVYWAGCFLFLLASMMLCDEHSEELEQIRRLARGRTWLISLCTSVALLCLAVIAPVATPYWLVCCHLQSRRESAYFSFLKRTHREFIFEPVDSADLPSATRAYFDRGREALVRLGFTSLGDYIMKEDPPDYFGRCFLSGDGTVICSLIDILDEQDYGFSTMFSGGRMLETSSSETCESMEWMRDNDRYKAIFASDQPIEEIWRRHREAIAEIIRHEGLSALAFERDAVHDFIRYEGRLFSELEFERGQLDEPPPAPQIPPHRVCGEDP